MEKGLLHVYTGDGKGKTTAAFGLAVRAYASGMRVYIVQFLKTSQSGETDFITRFGDARLRVFRFEEAHGFVYDSEAEQAKELRRDSLQAMAFVLEVFANNKCDLLVLDEIICAYNLRLITKEELCLLLENKPRECELVLTGRGAPQWLLARADYVTDMTLVKHPFQKGIGARKGIEF